MDAGKLSLCGEESFGTGTVIRFILCIYLFLNILQCSYFCAWLNIIHFHTRWRPHSWEGWTLGSTGVAFDPGHQTAKCGGYSEGPLAKIWKKLLYQVKGAHCCMTCLIISVSWKTETVFTLSIRKLKWVYLKVLSDEYKRKRWRRFRMYI